MKLLVNLADIQFSATQMDLARKVALEEAEKALEGRLTLLHLIDTMDMHHELSLVPSEIQKSSYPRQMGAQSPTLCVRVSNRKNMAITIPNNATSSELVLLSLTIQARAKASIVVALYSHLEPPYHRFLDDEIAVEVFDVLSTTMDLLASMGKAVLDSNDNDELYRLIDNFCTVWLFISREYKVELSSAHVHLADNIVEWEEDIKLLKSFVELKKSKVG